MLFFIELIINLIRSSGTRKKIDLLNKPRTEKDLQDFIRYFEEQEISTEVIKIAIDKLRTLLHNDKFMPFVEDSFIQDYHWKHFYSDQYSTQQMRIAAYIMDEINEHDLKESYWRTYEDEHGEIDDFQHLFHYIFFIFSLCIII